MSVKDISNEHDYMTKPKKSNSRKLELENLLSNSNKKDFRYLYFQAPRGYYVTAVTKLIREYNLLVVAFAFCSPKDTFCKKIGKIQCLKLINDWTVENQNVNNKYIVTIPFSNFPPILNVGFAYNLLIDKPSKLKHSKFFFNNLSGYIWSGNLEIQLSS